MGQLVTFQCPGCFRYWVLSREALEPVTVFRAAPQEAAGEAGAAGLIYLPFWVVEVEGAGLKAQIENAVKEIQGASQAVLQTGFAGCSATKLPASSETGFLAARLERLGSLMVYVPAF